MNIKCLIIDDEPIARKIIKEFIQKTGYLECLGEAEDPIAAAPFIAKGNVDLIFLDIEMPRITGMKFLKTLPESSFLTIITSAYPNYAVEGFELNILDYLVKPISFDRFSKACLKARQFMDQATHKAVDFFFVKSSGRIEKIECKDLIYIESIGNYLILHLSQRDLIVYLTLKGLFEQLPPEFIQIHKSYVINKSKINSIEGNEIKLDKYSVPMGQKMKEDVLKQILGNRILKR